MIIACDHMAETRFTPPNVFRSIKARVVKSFERDRRVEHHIEAFSRAIWPWQEQRLIFIATVLVLLDFLSTFIVLELSGKKFLSEGGVVPAWALETGGVGMLFLVDIGALAALVLLANIMRLLYLKLGFKGFARTAFVILLVPYAAVALAAIFNNILLAVL